MKLPCVAGAKAVHPHGRGERMTEYGALGVYFGSSPRTWGTLIGLRKVMKTARFIPTDVGNAFNLPSTQLNHPVHPHGRGERYTI